ncbi:MAG: preprotein translocase subunit SecE [Pseudomonadota bacterium]
MARAPRSQRRARREAQAQSRADRARQRQAQVRPSAQPVKQQTGRREHRERGRFVRESWAELQKVEWPNRSQLVQATVAVVIACAIVGAYLWVADQAFSKLVEKVLL